jgi:predicted ATPase
VLSKIEALNYRALRYVSQTLAPFQVLIGPNASGKSTFLDVVSFISDIVNNTAADAVGLRSADFRDLTWLGQSDWLELAVEAIVPNGIGNYPKLRYEIRIGIDAQTSESTMLSEILWLLTGAAASTTTENPQHLFSSMNGNHVKPPVRITSGSRQRAKAGWRKIVDKQPSGNDYFRSETTDWNNTFRLGPKRSALGNLPEDEVRFPVSTWFKRFITEGVRRIMLDSTALRRPSPPQSPRTFLPDGSNLPWVVHELEKDNPERLASWVAHIQFALPDVKTISTIERPEDRHRYLTVGYESGATVPSWAVSDGTLRMLALTILAYIPTPKGIYLIEEPENGIHPLAIEVVAKSLSSVYDAQILLATHSPIILSITKREDLLCFSRTEHGETIIIPGNSHPRLQDWQGDPNLSVLYAGGVL